MPDLPIVKSLRFKRSALGQQIETPNHHLRISNQMQQTDA